MKKRILFVLVTLVAAFAVLASTPEPTPNLEAALEAQRDLVADEPTNAVARNDFGNLLLLAGEPLAAEAAYREALELDPGFVSAHFNLGLLYQQRGEDDLAADRFQLVLDSDPEAAWAWYQLGVHHERKNNRNDAIEHYARAFALDSDLSFQSVNPQLIESRLVTEALLTAQQYSKPPAQQVPRMYGDPARIAELMLDRPEAEMAEGEGEVDADSDTESAVENVGNQGASNRGQRLDARFDKGTASSGQARDRRAARSESASEGGSNNNAGTVVGGDRVLTSDSLDESGSGQVRGDTAAPSTDRQGREPIFQRYRRSSSPRSNNRDEANATAEEQEQPRARPANPGSRLPQRLRNVRRSTGQLELQLLPPGEEPVRVARKDG
ncbi:MAG: tetratricopeptide repeat protein [Acidobacteriota bacterium]